MPGLTSTDGATASGDGKARAMFRQLNAFMSQWRGRETQDEYQAVRRYERNSEGRDFVVGDIHGMFAHLSALLDEVDFDSQRDRLFSVGDLVDRGPDSHKTLDWLARPWFHACRGNHEQFAIDSANGKDLEFWVRYNGGEWWLDLSPDQQQCFRAAFQALPLAMEVETDSGWVGIVHADVPTDMSWDDFTFMLTEGVEEANLFAMYARNRVHGETDDQPVEGRVDRVYCGHTPVRQPLTVGNVHFIDTAAVYIRENYAEARLTMVEIHPSRHREYHIRTDRGL